MNFGHWEIGLILRSMMRHKLRVTLIALQTAVTMAVIINSLSVIEERRGVMSTVSGVDEANSFFVKSTGITENFDEKSTIQSDLEVIRNTPGVLNAVQLNSTPMLGGGWNDELSIVAGENPQFVAVYMVDEHGLEALDLELIAGENFQASDVAWSLESRTAWQGKIIISKAMATRLYPDEGWRTALGKTLYFYNDEPVVVIGIIDNLQAPWIGKSWVERTLLSPEHLLAGATYYFVRAEPGYRDRIMAELEDKLARSNKDRLISDLTAIEDVKGVVYKKEQSIISLLSSLIVVLVSITAMGILGLVSYNVSIRTKQIGVRRALGADKSMIVRYFLMENFLIVFIGTLIGVALTIGLNMYLVESTEINPMDTTHIPIVMVILILIGQLSVIFPALKASNLSPAIATKVE